MAREVETHLLPVCQMITANGLSMTLHVLLSQGGIIYSNAVTTVSPTYAREALEGGAAGWLRSTLAKPEVRGKFKVRH